MRPVSHPRTVDRVTPTADASCFTVMAFASRSLLRSVGDGGGGGDGATGAGRGVLRVALCVIGESPQQGAGRKNT
ncbi:hypothetical protein GCM10023082_65380 [Streptomyces tremellae]|uniref:Uncharacterized protein n=1 Tax=Streptomyces tremellae TaxID=1124239 RepID=A0ABP7GF69_9ACTN